LKRCSLIIPDAGPINSLWVADQLSLLLKLDMAILGEKKKGDLAKLYVCKFYSQNQLYLLGYSIDDVIELLTLEVVGSHENFHRDFKK